MRIAYVFTHFPVPSEAFAGLEVKTLVELGNQVEVFCLRKPPPNAT